MVTLTATDIAPSTSALTRTYVGLLADSVSVRRIKSTLASEAFDVVASGPRVDGLLDGTLVPLDVAIVVGDLAALGRGGNVELLRNLRSGLPVVFVCKTGDRAAVRKALRAGAHAFVSYADLATSLPTAVQAAIAGQLAVPQSIRSRVSWETFSLREKQVLHLVAEGLTNAEIACRLFLSESTVKSHLSSSFRKLGVSSRAEAAAVVYDAEPGPRLAEPSGALAELEAQLLGSAAA